MNEISNNSMWFYKTVMPIGWFMIFGILTAGGFGSHNFAFAFCGTVFLIFGIIFFIKYAWLLPDHVYLANQAVIVERNGDKTTIAFKEIKKVGFDQTYKMVTLSLYSDKVVRFKPKFGMEGFSAFAPPPKVVTELINAINQSRLG